MGSGYSTSAVLGQHAAVLQRMVGAEAIPHGAPYWDQLFSLQVALASLDPADVELALAPHCRQLRERHCRARALGGAHMARGGQHMARLRGPHRRFPCSAAPAACSRMRAHGGQSLAACRGSRGARQHSQHRMLAPKSTAAPSAQPQQQPARARARSSRAPRAAPL